MGMSSGLTHSGAIVRLQRWWKPKAANLLGILYSVTLITALPFSHAIVLIAASVATILGIGTFGHLVNDLSDIRVDAIAGKPNRLAGMPGWQQASLLLGALAIGLLPWLILPFDAVSLALLLLEFVLLIVYAAPPLRLKERGGWAVFADSAYAYAIPALLAAHTFFLAAGRQDNRLIIASLVVWQVALGARHFLNHLALDRTNDIVSGTSTLATLNGNHYIHDLIRRRILPVELVGFGTYLAAVSRYAPFLLLVVAAILLFASFFPTILMLGRQYPLLSYRFSRTHWDDLYQDLLPPIVALYLVFFDWRFCVLVVLQPMLFDSQVRGLIVRMLGTVAMLAGNSATLLKTHSMRRIDGGANLPVQLMNAEAKHVADNRICGRTNIAVVNINKHKYTETFVDELLCRLHYNVYYLYGDELPRYDHEDRHFLSNWPRLQLLPQFVESMLRLEQNLTLKDSISSYLQAKRIRLVLAEFGPVGNQMFPITSDLGIPLVVCFHGYDAFHGETVRRCLPAYEGLFREAARIIVVSEVMLNRLEQLGAPRDKLVHLPAFVNLEQFPYSDHSSAGPRFLAVGRFVETKAPHLTLLAFHKVLQTIPEATLTMLGKGGGDELFGACLILARALGLDGRVEFRGVVSHEEVAMEMRRARVFVQHSLTSPETGDMEGKPVAVMEAMASGLAVVATRHSGIVELIEHEHTGLLVSEYDIEAMAVAMVRLAKDDGLVQEIGQQASAFIHQHPLISRHVEILEEVIAASIAAS